ncbi:hypothetical protein GCM10010439_33540 [Actinocorallia aurantiaca]|uniref:Uncharacterized protein n=1 Tax=Actinocorallia aurantiaca TaxID=46204 RepID=A0ABN3U9M0_9ACTN
MHGGGAGDGCVALEVHADDVVPVGLGQVEQHLVAQHARVVDHDVQRAEGVDGGGDEPLAQRPVADVAGHRDGLAALGLDLGDDPLGRRAHVVDDDVRALRGQREGLGAAEPGARAGDDGGAARQGEVCVHGLLPLMFRRGPPDTSTNSSFFGSPGLVEWVIFALRPGVAH